MGIKPRSKEICGEINWVQGTGQVMSWDRALLEETIVGCFQVCVSNWQQLADVQFGFSLNSSMHLCME